MKATIDQRLQASLYRHECPPALTLSDYQMRLLPQQEQSKVASHVARCPHCQAELERLELFLAPNAAAPTWQQSIGFIWQHIQDKGTILVRLLQETGLPAQPLTLAVKGRRSDSQQNHVVRHITLSPDETGDVDLEAIVWRPSPSSPSCRVTVRVQIPSRWPELAGVRVQGTARTWQRIETTNHEGEVILDNLPEEWLADLSLEVQP